MEEWGVCPPPPSRLQWLPSSPPTSLVDRQTAKVGGRAIGVYVGGGVPVGIYRVVEGMGITNFTMAVPTVQSSRAPLEGHRLGWVGGKLWSAVEGGRWGHRLVRGRPELGRRAGARQSQVVR